jgi:hypothetical protein
MEEGICEFGIQKFYALCIRSNQSSELVQCTYRLLLAVVQNESIPNILIHKWLMSSICNEGHGKSRTLNVKKKLLDSKR